MFVITHVELEQGILEWMGPVPVRKKNIKQLENCYSYQEMLNGTPEHKVSLATAIAKVHFPEIDRFIALDFPTANITPKVYIALLAAKIDGSTCSV